MNLIDGLPVFGTHDENTLAQLRDVASRAERVALMADGHLGYIMPVGGVAAYRGKVSVAGVGFDIACGNAAIRTNLAYEQIAPHRAELADLIQSTISFGMGRTNKADDAPLDDPMFEDATWDAIGDQNTRVSLREKARHQLGTVGSGNHYVDVMVDENGTVWVGVHFGSRGFGHGGILRRGSPAISALTQGARVGRMVVQIGTFPPGQGKMVQVHRCPATVTGDEIRNGATARVTRARAGRRGE